MSFAPILAKSTLINSKDRIAGSISAQNFIADLSVPGKEADSKVILAHALIPHTWKNINVNTYGIRVTEDVDAENDPQVYTFTMATGNYNASQLATQLASELTTASAASGQSITYSCSYDANQNAFTFSTATAGKTFQFNWTNSASTMYRILGFSNSADSSVVANVAGTPTGSVASISSDLSPLVNGISSVELHINHFNDGNNTEDVNRTSDIIVSIPITSTFGEVLVYKPNFEQFQFDIPNLHDHVQFRLSCNYNNGTGRVDLPSDSDWSLFLVDLENAVDPSIKRRQFVGKTGYLGVS